MSQGDVSDAVYNPNQLAMTQQSGPTVEGFAEIARNPVAYVTFRATASSFPRLGLCCRLISLVEIALVRQSDLGDDLSRARIYILQRSPLLVLQCPLMYCPSKLE